MRRGGEAEDEVSHAIDRYEHELDRGLAFGRLPSSAHHGQNRARGLPRKTGNDNNERARRMKRSPKQLVMIAALAGGAFVSVFGVRGLFADPPQTGTASPPATAEPVPALTPYIEAHTHFDAADPEGSVRAALAALTRQNAAMVLFQMPPDTFDHPGHYDAEVVLAEAIDPTGTSRSIAKSTPFAEMFSV